MLKRILFFIFIGILPLCIWASGLSISPIHIHFAPGEKIATITLKNTSDEPITLQTKLYQWRQAEGQDNYVPTQDLIASPAMFKIAPRSKQLVRIALRNPEPSAPEQQKTYRLVLNQILPMAVKTKPKTDLINTKLKITLPIFIDPKTISTQLVAKKMGSSVEIINTGNVTRLINQIEWLKADHSLVAAPQAVFIYLLPGSHYTLPVAAKATTLKVLTNRKVELLELK